MCSLGWPASRQSLVQYLQTITSHAFYINSKNILKEAIADMYVDKYIRDVET